MNPAVLGIHDMPSVVLPIPFPCCFMPKKGDDLIPFWLVVLTGGTKRGLVGILIYSAKLIREKITRTNNFEQNRFIVK